MDTRTSPARLRIERIQELLREQGVAAVVVPSSDPHLSEYLPERWQARQWASGFTGSMAHAGRHRRARRALRRQPLLGPGRAPARRQRHRAGPDRDSRGGAAHRLAVRQRRPRRRRSRSTATSSAWPRRASSATRSRAAASPCAATSTSSRSPGPSARRRRRARSTSTSRRRRRTRAPPSWRRCARRWRQRARAITSISTVDDIAWLLNLRGADVGYNPVFLAHLLLDRETATLFVGAGKIDATLVRALAGDGVRIAAYDAVTPALAALPADATLLVDPKRTTFGLVASTGAQRIEAINPSTLAKSRKSDAEAAHVRQAMIEDGIAMCEFYAWFEAALADPRAQEPITELTIDARLTEARSRRPGYVGPSFATIAAFNANGAMPHYRALPESHARIEGDGLLLIDSGAQYRGGTTDITRDVADRPHQRGAAPRRDAGAARHDGAQPRALPARHAVADARRDRARAALGARPRLRPRHRPRRRLFPQRPRRAADDLARHRRAGDGDGAGDDHERRARPLPARPVGRAGREPGPQRAGREPRRQRVRRVPRVRDADAVPDRHALHRSGLAARRRGRLAQRLSRDGRGAPRARPERLWRWPGCASERSRSEGVGGRGNA